MEAFEQLDVWKRSTYLCSGICRKLATCKFYALRDQIIRSSVSVPSNIAEGYERNSSREFSRFLKIAKGSCGELRTQLLIAQNIGVINESIAKTWIQETFEISRMLQGLINKIDARDCKAN